MNRIIPTSLIVVLYLGVSMHAWSQETEFFNIGGIKTKAGEMVSGFLSVPAAEDKGVEIPVSVLHGIQPGPVLVLLAGIHGYEYAPITALQRVRRQLEPNALSGTLILVHVANPPSFLGRTIYKSPVDGKNLNRMFPGKIDGTQSQRIAYVITTEVIERADYLVDLHSGDGNEALRPFLYLPVTGNNKLDTATKGMALAFGLDHVLLDDSELVSPDVSVYADRTAMTRGIPAITTETGQLGLNDEKSIELAEKGIWNLLRHLKMIEGKEITNEAVVWLQDSEVITSPQTGIFQAAVRDGYVVAKGGLIGVLVDFFGDMLSEIHAPFAGVVNYVVGTPPVSEGEPLAMISRIKSE